MMLLQQIHWVSLGYHLTKTPDSSSAQKQVSLKNIQTFSLTGCLTALTFVLQKEAFPVTEGQQLRLVHGQLVFFCRRSTCTQWVSAGHSEVRQRQQRTAQQLQFPSCRWVSLSPRQSLCSVQSRESAMADRTAQVTPPPTQ